MTKSIFIVGAGPGIGFAAAHRFGKAGAHIILGARRAEKLYALVAELTAQGIKADAVEVDATVPASLRKAFAEADQLTGGLETVLFNAAFVRAQDLFSMADADIEADLAVNAAAGFHTIRAAVETFGDRGGNILVTGGGLAITPHASYASLGAGKAALRNMVQGLAPDLAERKVRLQIASVSTLVAPGSQESKDVAEIFLAQATGRISDWEVVYPPMPSI